MRALLLAGLGPYFKSSTDLVGSYFDHSAVDGLVASSPTDDRISLDDLAFVDSSGGRHRLLRRERSGSLSIVIDGGDVERAPIPNLVSFTLQSILRGAGVSFSYLPLDAVWADEDGPAENFDVVLLSTTFICDRHSLARAVRWVAERYPGALLVVGGQYSNLKYQQILRRYPEVYAVVRGDGEAALPRLLKALDGRAPLDAVPNLVVRNAAGTGVVDGGLTYIDLDAMASPSFPGHARIVPYESMRGCPYACKFCSFPAASPRWRYKSAEKIVQDWARYRDENGARHIRALDSTFTVPPRRFHRLLELLPDVGIGWEAFTRANSIHSEAIVEALARANCRTLSIGFESMSDNSLDYMNKKVSAKQNRRAFELLEGGPVGYRMSFMVGYPGETPADYEETHNFLVHDYVGHFQLYVFSLQDETMPVWDDAERFAITVTDPEDPDYAWSHVGMDVETAGELRRRTLREVRWRNDDAVALLWQTDYQTPLLPHRSAKENYRLEKLVERFGMTPIDFPDLDDARRVRRQVLADLADLGVFADGRVLT